MVSRDGSPSGPEEAASAVVVMGLVREGPCGVRDYGELLSAQLHRQGTPATAQPMLAGGPKLRSCIDAARRHLRQARCVPRSTTVIWSYSSFAYGYRGIPLHGVFFGAVLRLRGVRVVTVVHEAAPSWQLGLRRGLVAVLQRLVLPVVLLGSTVTVVTTPRRATWLAPLAKLLRRRVEVIPVFSNIPVVNDAVTQQRGDQSGRGSVAVLCHRWAEAHGKVLLEGLRILSRNGPVPAVLLGAPDMDSRSGQAWRVAARQAGVDSTLEITGAVTPEEFSRRLQACAVAVLVNVDGPNGRRSTLAAAAGHGCAVVALDGPDRWELLIDEGAIRVVPPDGSTLAAAVRELLDQPKVRQDLGERAAAFYRRHMSLDLAGEAFAGLVGTAAARRLR